MFMIKHWLFIKLSKSAHIFRIIYAHPVKLIKYRRLHQFKSFPFAANKTSHTNNGNQTYITQKCRNISEQLSSYMDRQGTENEE